MKYIIMILIVLGLAIVDFITGIIKAYIKEDLSSSAMRRGGVGKLAELIIMVTACGLELGIGMLGQYCDSPELASAAGIVSSGVVFFYIICMELISILENYGDISPDAAWVRTLTKKLRSFGKDKEDEK